ncbi:copper homeostasis periplasmic binding protein CopC [Pseudomonas sp. RIT-PI-S]|uniref:copper homeostasis periplasmic binding protein CopC n=1 Tax=Pseudomonas sp. RIT-PI-S TaxID=3035295 RepID=UPI0021DA4BB3|nr:copper homeostasis periplasmic binding protein CopC [Pseudomonas sp. RIT-PI-S]
MKTSAVLAFALASCLSSMAWAHAHLRQPSPAENSTVIAPAEVRLGFSEGVEPAFSEVTLIDAGGQSVKTQLRVADHDPNVLLAKPLAPLTPGTWQVKWKVVSVDTHRSEGQYAFTVK